MLSHQKQSYSLYLNTAQEESYFSIFPKLVDSKKMQPDFMLRIYFSLLKTYIHFTFSIESNNFYLLIFRYSLKPENVLVGRDGYVKLADFGLSKENVEGNHEAKSLCGTAEYLSPEILLRQGHGKASDWWSFGAMIYEMLCGLPPFYSKEREKLYKNIKYGEPRLDMPFLSEAAKDLCRKLLEKDPNKRLGSGERDA